MKNVLEKIKNEYQKTNILFFFFFFFLFFYFFFLFFFSFFSSFFSSKIIESICNNPESRDMVLQAISTIDVICMSDAEHRDICVNEGAEECVDVVMDTYSSDREIVEACKSTLLSIRVRSKIEKNEKNEKMKNLVNCVTIVCTIIDIVIIVT